VRDGNSKILLHGQDGFLNQSKNELLLEVFKLDSIWTFNYIGNSLNDTFFLGEIVKKLDRPLVNTGFYIKQSTASFFYKHHFDNWYSGPILRDTIPPHCLAVDCIDQHTLKLNLSDPIHHPHTAS